MHKQMPTEIILLKFLREILTRFLFMPTTLIITAITATPMFSHFLQTIRGIRPH